MNTKKEDAEQAQKEACNLLLKQWWQYEWQYDLEYWWQDGKDSISTEINPSETEKLENLKKALRVIGVNFTTNKDNGMTTIKISGQNVKQFYTKIHKNVGECDIYLKQNQDKNQTITYRIIPHQENIESDLEEPIVSGVTPTNVPFQLRWHNCFELRHHDDSSTQELNEYDFDSVDCSDSETEETSEVTINDTNLTSSDHIQSPPQEPERMFVPKLKENAIDQYAWIIRPAKKTEKGKKLSTILEEFCCQTTMTPNITFVGFQEGNELKEKELSYAFEVINRTYGQNTPFGTLEVKDPVNANLILPKTTAGTILINDTKGNLEQLTIHERQHTKGKKATQETEGTYVQVANAPKLKRMSVPKDAVIHFDKRIEKDTLDLSGVTQSITLEFHDGCAFENIKLPNNNVTVNIYCADKTDEENLKKWIAKNLSDEQKRKLNFSENPTRKTNQEQGTNKTEQTKEQIN